MASRVLVVAVLHAASCQTSTDEQKGASVLVGLMTSLSVGIDAAALPQAMDVRCNFQLASTYAQLQKGLSSLMDAPQRPTAEQSIALTQGARHLARALRRFASQSYSCSIMAAGELSQHASRLFALNESSVGIDPHVRVHIGGVDVGQRLMRAASALQRGRHRQAGIAFGSALVEAEMGDALYDRDSWAVTDAHGRVKLESELEAHWHARREQRLRRLWLMEQSLASVPPPRPEAAFLDTLEGSVEDGAAGRGGGQLCCCCWASPAEAQETNAGAHTAHVL